MKKEGIRTKKQLNEVLIRILRELGREMTANQLCDYILANFKTANLRINSLIICKRLAGQPNIESRYGKGSVHYYKYVE